MDQIIKSYLDDFKKYQGFSESISDSRLFEHFVNFCVVNRIDPERSEIERINVGGKSNPGVDGLAVLANEKVVFEPEEIDSIYDFIGFLEMEFIFTQAKISPKFEMGEIGNFVHSVKQFFAPSTTLKYEEEMLMRRNLKNYIYEHSIRLNRKPKLVLYYVTLGAWKDDQNILSIIQSGQDDLLKLEIFDSVRIILLDNEKISAIYRELKNKITREINFDKHTILPKISNIKESYVGILQASELIKLISHDNEGGLNKQLFNDNIRDFQGFNSVNTEIRETVIGDLTKDKFALFNNGITLVARSINKIGTSFRINDFQIVNGCQTCHVLYHLKENISSDIYVPFKLIVTDDSDVTNRIVKATNRQTEIKSEAFETLSPFHRKLEEFYLSFEKDPIKRRFYERRTKQYDNSSINKLQIVPLPMQTTSFLSMFLNEPHSTPRYYGELLRAYRTKLFQDHHSYWPYYTSGYAQTKVESLLRKGILDGKYRRFKYHLLLLFRLLTVDKETPPLDSKKIEDYCEKILAFLWNEEKCIQKFNEAGAIIDKALVKYSGEKSIAHRVRGFSELLVPGILENKKNGTLKYYNPEKGYGFLHSDNEECFVHVSDFQKANLNPNMQMDYKFDIVETDRGLKATNIEAK
ncbi:AIPR family protein [Leptospira yasudae]|uniref:AIPR protein n=1 Tax=Leptospira yasudae TaxID=2202201 RepID=A0ABX9LX72_9LEPT|nr:AIPR family protein [Leptospira yasudae]RHX77459.1 AIPR protein [Leptospira yasudae]